MKFQSLYDFYIFNKKLCKIISFVIYLYVLINSNYSKYKNFVLKFKIEIIYNIYMDDKNNIYKYVTLNYDKPYLFIQYVEMYRKILKKMDIKFKYVLIDILDNLETKRKIYNSSKMLNFIYNSDKEKEEIIWYFYDFCSKISKKIKNKGQIINIYNKTYNYIIYLEKNKILDNTYIKNILKINYDFIYNKKELLKEQLTNKCPYLVLHINDYKVIKIGTRKEDNINPEIPIDIPKCEEVAFNIQEKEISSNPDILNVADLISEKQNIYKIDIIDESLVQDIKLKFNKESNNILNKIKNLIIII